MNLNKKHFDYYKKQVKKYQKEFGLEDWNIKVVSRKTCEKFYNGYCEAEWWNGKATIGLITQDYRTELDSIWEDLKETARHEVIHIILNRFDCLCRARHVTDNDVRDELEVVVRKFTRLLDKS